MPKTRVDFWQAKFTRNVERDERKERELIAAAWTVLTIWECETRDPTSLADKLRGFLGAPGNRPDSAEGADAVVAS